MIEITDEMEDKLNDIGTALSETLRICRIIQACFDDKESDIDEVGLAFKCLRSKLIETKKDFNNIQIELQI